MYDVIIIGGGPSGFSASIYTARKAWKTLMITEIPGGEIVYSTKMDNYPGFERTSGAELMQVMQQQSQNFGVKFEFEKVSSIEKKEDNFIVKAGDNEFETKSIIIATGRKARKIGLQKEEELFGRGIQTCVTCDAPLYKDKVVAVVGGGNSALDGVEELYRAGVKKIYLIHRRNEFRGDETQVERVKNMETVEITTPYNTIELKGDKMLSSIVVENAKTKEKKEIQLDGMFLEIGSIPNTGFLKDFIKINDKGEIVVDDNKTTVEGVFAAGDVTTIKFKQAITASGDGAMAALECNEYLRKKDHKK